MQYEGYEWETILAWRALCQLQMMLEDCDATIRIYMDKGAIQASGTITIKSDEEWSTDYVNAEGTELAVTLMALGSAANARLVQAGNTITTERR